jgi:hypothetical protein
MAVVLVPFFEFSEIGRDFGGDELYELFFVRRAKYVPSISSYGLIDLAPQILRKGRT